MLLTIAYIGCITLFVAATIAIVATDIKRVLAYSTISQLGYMMLALGVGGWVAGLFHLITHAFFKSLLFLGSGSVIHGCHHEQEMPQMGGLRKKMPITAYTMLVGVIAIAGLAIPVLRSDDRLFGLSLEGRDRRQALAFTTIESGALPVVLRAAGAARHHRVLHVPAVVLHVRRRAARSAHVYDHAHESPR